MDEQAAIQTWVYQLQRYGWAATPVEPVRLADQPTSVKAQAMIADPEGYWRQIRAEREAELDDLHEAVAELIARPDLASQIAGLATVHLRAAVESWMEREAS